MRSNRLRSVGLWLSAASAFLSVGASIVRAQVPLTPVALTGEPAPGTSEQFIGFGVPVISPTGHLGFEARTTNTALGVFAGIWNQAPSQALRDVVLLGATSGQGDVIGGFENFVMANTGDVLFFNDHFFRAGSGGLQRLLDTTGFAASLDSASYSADGDVDQNR